MGETRPKGRNIKGMGETRPKGRNIKGMGENLSERA